jgi:O-antigen ligase
VTAPGNHLYRIRVREIWGFLRTQPPSYWLICGYLFFEYVRPQQIYPALTIIPWPFLCLVACVVSRLIERKHLQLRTPAGPLIIAYAGVVFLSSFFAYDPAVSFEHLSLFFGWVLVYVLITNIVTTEKHFFLFMLSFLLYSVKMAQHATRSWATDSFVYRDWGAAGAPGWFTNSGELAVQMAILLPLSTYFLLALRKHWGRWKLTFFAAFPLMALVAVLGSSSRGGVLGMASVVLWMLLKSRHKMRALVIASVTTVAALTLLPPEQQERFGEMGSDRSSLARLEYVEAGIEMMNRFPLTGIGYHNWLVYYRTHYTPRYNRAGEVPHNIFIEAGAELGYPGLSLLLALIVATLVINHRTRRLAPALSSTGRFLWYMAHGLDAALVAFVVCGQFVTILYYPFFWINLSMTVALHTATVREFQRVRGQQAVRLPPGRHRLAPSLPRGAAQSVLFQK